LVRWGLTIRIAVPATLLTALGPLLSMQLTLQNYDTAIPLQTYQATIYVVILMSVVFGFLLLGGAVALLTSFYSESTAALGQRMRRLLGVDAAIALLAAIGMGLILHQVQALLMDHFHTQALFSVGSPDLIVSSAPALVAVANAFRSTIFDGAMLGTIALIAGRLSSGWMKLLAGLLAVFILLPLDIRTAGEFTLEYGIALLTVAGAVLFCVHFARGNYLAYAVVLWALSFRGPLGELFGTSIPAMHLQAWIIVAVLAASVLWAVLPGVTATAKAEAA
jgi:hypothetical protein